MKVNEIIPSRQDKSGNGENREGGGNHLLEIRGFESLPVELSQQPEASLAWRAATYVVKRRQRVSRPCD